MNISQYSKFQPVILILLLSGITVSQAQTNVTIGGRIQLDGALYNEDITELGSGTEFRRLRLFAQGDLAPQWNYKVQLDFADGNADIKDAYVRYNGLTIGRLTIGHFKAPFMLEEQTSSKYITFMERALPNIFIPDRRIGVGLSRVQGVNTFSAAVFGNSAADNNNDEGLGIAGRFTHAPKLNNNSFVHFGLSAAFEEPTSTDDASDTIRFRARPESHVTSVRLVDGGTINDVNNITKAGLEGAYVNGPFSLQGEYLMTRVDATAGNVDYDGYYVFASYFPWGGSRPYKNGVFGRVKAEHTWEFALRYSNLDLSETGGGEQNNLTFAANYYIQPNLRIMANYILADVENGINGDEDPGIIQMRIAMDF